MQTLVVALLVLGCTVYAAWKLMPGAARRVLATALLRLSWPEFMARPLRRATVAAAGCGCDGCDHAPAKPQGQGAQVVTFHRRARH